MSQSQENSPSQHRHVRAVVGVAVVLTIASFLSACGVRTVGASDGPIIDICGTNIGRATSTPGDGPVYIDAPRHPPTASIDATAGSAPITVRVSESCGVGAKVRVSDAKVIKVRNNLNAKDGAVEAAVVYPIGVGRATLTAARRGERPISVTIAVLTLTEWCRAKGDDCPASANAGGG